MTRTIWLRFGFLFALLGMLGACGGTGAPAAGRAPTVVPPSREPTSPVATVPALGPVPEATNAAEGGIPQGVTAEGYHVLGRPDAPVTLTMYSDFL